MKPGKQQTEPTASATPSGADPPREAPAPAHEQPRRLPLTSAPPGAAADPTRVVEPGSAAAPGYKRLSYELLHLEPGQQVLDVGCGSGGDLPALAERVGTEGLVIGVDQDPNQLKTAHEASAGRSNVRLAVAEARALPFPHRSFDAVRTDRVLQYIPEAAQALAEMTRVLQPGGRLVLVEPDWPTIALFPASPEGGDADHTWSAIVHWCRRHLPHALIGRQLAALLEQQGAGVWEQVQVQAVAYTFRSWPLTNAVLQVTNLALSLAQAEPTRAGEIDAWLQAMEAAALCGEFFACVPLFFAQARKAATKAAPYEGDARARFT